MKVLFVFILFLSGINYANSCKCGIPTLNEAIDNSDLIFRGIPIFEKEIGDYAFSYVFKINKIWKGSANDTLLINPEEIGSSCNMKFKLNNEYVIFLNRGTTDICTRNNLSINNPDIEKLDNMFFK